MTRALLAVLLVTSWAAAAHAEGEVALAGQVQLVAAARALAPADSPLNPGNRVLRLPQATLTAELRPSLEVRWGTWLTVVARPRLIGAVAAAHAVGAWDDPDAAASVLVPELFAVWQVSDWLALAWGVQNFQWGPGELASPSNALFHETGLLQDPLYLVQGRHLARANLSVGRELSGVLLVEVSDASAAPFIAREPFSPSAHAKLEYAEANGRWLVGVTASAPLEHDPTIGEYGQLQLTDAIALFLDVGHAHERRAWYPLDGRFVHPAHDARHLGELVIDTTALVGARWSFENGGEARVEWLEHPAGWDEAQLIDATAVVAASGDVEPWLAPGFELIGRRFVYLALRVPELPPAKGVTIQPRVLCSATDRSAAAFVTVSADVGDATVAFLSALAIVGEPTDELARLVRGAITVGVINTW
ncbi:MAG: hypothetical protein A2138_18455 [Deltaproteobacteria bacterium RBG_16_71_12]|nr:MAG: hypothetical protein A2138_18455 [Deltaproteobacteria bacterium RBG_16_71_12]